MGQEAVDVARIALLQALLIAVPILGAGLVVGLLISLFQAVTQIQEQTLTFVPKIIFVFGILGLLGPWLISQIVVFTQRIFEAINGLRAMGLEPRIAGVCGLTTNQGTPSDPDYFEQLWGRSVLVFHRQERPTQRTNCFGFQPYTRFMELKPIRSGRDDEADIAERWTNRSTVDELMVNANAAQLITQT